MSDQALAITDEMVEAAARAIYLSKDSVNEWMWEHETVMAGSRQRYMRMARTALEAALAVTADEEAQR